MPLVLTVPNEYGYVLLAATSTFLLNTIHTINTGAYRKPAGVPYPHAYATEAQCKENPAAYSFNCAQRAHAHFTENHLSALGALLIAGLRFPLVAAALGAGWSVARLAYMVGYSRSSVQSQGKGRYKGSAFWLFQSGLIGLAVWTGVQMVLGN